MNMFEREGMWKVLENKTKYGDYWYYWEKRDKVKRIEQVKEQINRCEWWEMGMVMYGIDKRKRKEESREKGEERTSFCIYNSSRVS